jgi:hypothetical protein
MGQQLARQWVEGMKQGSLYTLQQCFKEGLEPSEAVRIRNDEVMSVLRKF